MRRRGLTIAISILLAVAWSLVLFRVVVHVVPPNLDNPAVRLLLLVTSPLIGLPPGEVTDFVLFRESILRPIVAAVVLALVTLAAWALVGGRELDNEGG